jgi:membrane associated rhomboid family serine protease
VINWLVFVGLIVVFAFQVAERRKFNAQMGEEILKQIEKHVDEGDSLEEAIEHVQKGVQEILLEKTMYRFALKGWEITGLLGHMWLHADIFHLLGNLLFLWLFGNAVCSKLGNIAYLPLYIGLGLAAGVSHLLFTGGVAVGASGAINGLVGMYLVFFPENVISCVWLFWFPLMVRPFARTFHVRSFWMILLWFAFDIWGAARGGQGVAYSAHIGGLVVGAALAVLMLKLKLVTMESYEKSLLQLIGIDKTMVKEEVRTDFAPWQQEYLTSAAAVSKSETIPQKPKPPSEELIRFKCFCGKSIKVPAKYTGRIGVCPECKSKVKIPEAPATETTPISLQPTKANQQFIRLRCQCGQTIKVAREHAGKIGRCPKCSKQVKVPQI